MKKILITLCSILVLIIPNIVNALSINKDKLELEVDKTATLEIKDLEEGQTVEWSTNAAGIATVENGTVKAIAKGDATITAIVKDSENNTVTNGTFTCTVTVKEAEKEKEEEEKPKEEKVDLTIKSVKINGAEIKKNDDKTYSVDVTDKDKFATAIKDLDKNLKLELNDTTKKAAIAIGSIDGKNQFVVVVTDGTNKESYTFKINYPAENTYLSKLEVTGYAFDQTFNKDTTSYTVTIPYEVTTVTINANPEDDNAKVSPNVSFTKDNLQVGGNTISIKVTNGNDSRTYKIFITRSEETKLEEKTTSIITSKNTSSGDSGLDIPETDNPDSMLNYVIITLGSLVLLSIGGVGMYFFIKTSPKRMKKELMKKRNKKEESPIVEIKEEKETKETKKEIKDYDDDIEEL